MSYQTNNSTYTYLANLPYHAYEAAVFIYKRVPNFYELFAGCIPYAIFQTAIGSYRHKLGKDNPTTKAVLRDISIAISISMLSLYEIEIASTSVTYDGGIMLGAIALPTCKVIIIGSSYILSPYDSTLATSSIISNFMCRPLLRMSKVASREYQNTCKNSSICTLSYEDFTQQNIKKIFLGGIEETIPKVFTSNFLIGKTGGPFFKKITEYTKILSETLATKTCLLITEQEINTFHNYEGFYQKAAVCFTAINTAGFATKTVIYSLFAYIETTTIILQEVLFTYIFAPSSNAIADSSIPNLLFDSTHKFLSTVLATLTGIFCYLHYGKSSDMLSIAGHKTSMDINTAFCITTGVFTKIGIDIISDNLEITLSGEDSTFQHSEDL